MSKPYSLSSLNNSRLSCLTSQLKHPHAPVTEGAEPADDAVEGIPHHNHNNNNNKGAPAAAATSSQMVRSRRAPPYGSSTTGGSTSGGGGGMTLEKAESGRAAANAMPTEVVDSMLRVARRMAQDQQIATRVQDLVRDELSTWAFSVTHSAAHSPLPPGAGSPTSQQLNASTESSWILDGDPLLAEGGGGGSSSTSAHPQALLLSSLLPSPARGAGGGGAAESAMSPGARTNVSDFFDEVFSQSFYRVPSGASMASDWVDDREEGEGAPDIHHHHHQHHHCSVPVDKAVSDAEGRFVAEGNAPLDLSPARMHPPPQHPQDAMMLNQTSLPQSCSNSSSANRSRRTSPTCRSAASSATGRKSPAAHLPHSRRRRRNSACAAPADHLGTPPVPPSSLQPSAAHATAAEVSLHHHHPPSLDGDSNNTFGSDSTTVKALHNHSSGSHGAMWVTAAALAVTVLSKVWRTMCLAFSLPLPHPSSTSTSSSSSSTQLLTSDSTTDGEGILPPAVAAPHPSTTTTTTTTTSRPSSRRSRHGLSSHVPLSSEAVAAILPAGAMFLNAALSLALATAPRGANCHYSSLPIDDEEDASRCRWNTATAADWEDEATRSHCRHWVGAALHMVMEAWPHLAHRYEEQH